MCDHTCLFCLVLEVRDYIREGDIWADTYTKWGSVLVIYRCVRNYPRMYWLKTTFIISRFQWVWNLGMAQLVPASGSASFTRLQSRCPLGLQALQTLTGKNLLPVSLRKVVGRIQLLPGWWTDCWPRGYLQFSVTSACPQGSSHTAPCFIRASKGDKPERERARLRSAFYDLISMQHQVYLVL